MSTRKNKSRNKSSAKKSLFKENTEDCGLPKNVKESDVKKSKSVRSKQTGLDSFTILKKAGETLQDDISEESFNPPLHSTAVYTEDEDLLERTKGSLEKSSNQASIGPSASQKKSVKQRNKSQKHKTAFSVKSSLTPRNVPGKKRKTSQKPATPEQDLEASKKDKSSEHEEEETGSTHNKTSPAEQATANKSHEKTKPTVKGIKTPNKKKLNKSKQKEQIPMTVWSPEDAPVTAKDVNELDVILFESEQLVERYRESIDDTSRKAVDRFFLSFKDQLTTSIKNLRMLKDLKRKNAKVRLEIGRKQKRLIEVKDEIIKKQPRLSQLQRKCTELEARQKSIQNTKTFLDNLGELQEGYRKYRTKNPNINETYGVSSLPALILQAQGTMRAEQHFHNINAQLQNAQTLGN